MNDTSRFCKECGYQFAEVRPEPAKPSDKKKKKKSFKAVWFLLMAAGLAAACYFTSFHKTAAAWLRRVRPVPDDEQGAELFRQERLRITENGTFQNNDGDLSFVYQGLTYIDFVTADLDADGRNEMLISGRDGNGGMYLQIYGQNNGEAIMKNIFPVKTGEPRFLEQNTEFYDNGVILIDCDENTAQFISAAEDLDSMILRQKAGDPARCVSLIKNDTQFILATYRNTGDEKQEITEKEYVSLKKDLVRANRLQAQPVQWTPENLGYEIRSQVILDRYLKDHAIKISDLPGNYRLPVNAYGNRDDFWGRYYMDSHLSLSEENNGDGTKTLRFFAEIKNYPYTGIAMTYSVFDRYTGFSFECNYDGPDDADSHACAVAFPLDEKEIEVTAVYHNFEILEEDMPVLMEVTVPEDYEGAVFMIGVEFDPVEVNTDETDFSKGLLHLHEWASPDGRYLYFTESDK